MSVGENTYDNNRLPGLADTLAAKGTAVVQVDTLTPGGKSRGREDALGNDSRGGNELLEADHLVR